MYFGYPSSTGEIPFKKLSEANKYAKDGYKKLKTYKEFNDNLFKYIENNPGVSEEMRYITEQGIIRRAKIRAVQEEATKNYNNQDFTNAIQKPILKRPMSPFWIPFTKLSTTPFLRISSTSSLDIIPFLLYVSV